MTLRYRPPLRDGVSLEAARTDLERIRKGMIDEREDRVAPATHFAAAPLTHR